MKLNKTQLSNIIAECVTNVLTEMQDKMFTPAEMEEFITSIENCIISEYQQDAIFTITNNQRLWWAAWNCAESRLSNYGKKSFLLRAATMNDINLPQNWTLDDVFELAKELKSFMKD